MTDAPVSVKVLPRELKVGHVAEVWVPARNDPNSTGPRGWTWRKIVFVEKKPGKRPRGGEPSPTRYRVRYEDVTGTSTLAPHQMVTITLASYEALKEA